MKIKVVEVSPRDGLQNEKAVITTEDKAAFIQELSKTGLKTIEATSFVRPGVIPALSDAKELWPLLPKNTDIRFTALVPNKKGMLAAMEAGVKEVAVFTATSESFCKKNINCTIDESIERFKRVFELARENNITVRGYISTVTDCPYEGRTSAEKCAELAEILLENGAYEISLGETIGTAVPADIRRLLDTILKTIPAQKLAGHFHDTRGTALANVFAAIESGLTTFDASAGGLGGCPYAKGASGNLATEDLIYSLERSGYETGVSLAKVAEASAFIESKIQRPLVSRVYQALQGMK